jgi:hypothetical protein
MLEIYLKNNIKIKKAVISMTVFFVFGYFFGVKALNIY